MSCYYPLQGYIVLGEKTKNGRQQIVFNAKDAKGPIEKISVPCGRCIGCRIDYSRTWALRCVHEAQIQEEKGLLNCFITLTYDEDHYTVSLNKTDFRDFMKRLRAFHSRKRWSPAKQTYLNREEKTRASKIRFYHCGEYGDKNGRAHHHALIFGYDFPDKECVEVHNGYRYYESETLAKLWTNGRHILGDLTWESAAYCARYTTKKINGKAAEEHYKRPDIHTGEILQVVPEFATMSRRPGIGQEWYERYGSELHKADCTHVNGVPFKPGSYYDKKLDERDPEALQLIKAGRIKKMKGDANETMLRRKAKREVKQAQVKHLVRNI